jgi:serine/threonine-protein kinase
MSAVPFQANERFGQYTLIRPIAIGGMAEVWLAKLEGVQGFEKKVALKRMTASLAENPQFVAMFLDEARLMAGLTHPNICQVFELGERDESFYVAMEFIAGQTVHNVMRTTVRKQLKLPLELAVKICRDAADALSYAHTKCDENGMPLHIIHRDVSPQNLMVTYEGVVKLLDFGIAKAATRTTATEVGQLKGKLSYMPPEQARGEDIDPRADQFALGVTLFEMVTHTRLYRAMKEMDLFREVATGTEPYPLAHERDPAVPEELSAIIQKMMARDREQRFATMAEARDRLTQFLQSISTSLPSNEAMAHYMRLVFPPEDREKDQGPLLATPHRQSGSFGPVPAPPAVDVDLEGLTARPSSKKAVIAAVAAVGVLALGGTLYAASRSPADTVMAAPPVVASPKDSVTAGAVDAGPARDVVEPPPVIDESDAALAIAPAPADDDKPKQKPKPVVPREKGKLSLQTTPWSNVYFGGKNLGETPLVNVELPAGRHRLKLVNDEKKLSTTIEVEIKPNQTTGLKLKL